MVDWDHLVHYSALALFSSYIPFVEFYLYRKIIVNFKFSFPSYLLRKISSFVRNLTCVRSIKWNINAVSTGTEAVEVQNMP